MANFILKSSIIILLVSLISCQNNEENIPQQNQDILEELNLSLEINSEKIFEYENTDQLRELSKKSVLKIESEAKEIIAEREDVTDILFLITFKNNTAKFVEITFYNKSTKEVVESRNYSRGNYSLSEDYDKIIGEAFGSCPAGFERIGSCSNVGNVEDCVSDIVDRHLSSNIGGIGDCAGVIVSVGSLSTKICGISGCKCSLN